MNGKMFFCSCFVLCIAAVSVCGRVYLYFPVKMTQVDALAKCQSYGMTLLELRSKTELDRWNSMKFSLFSLHPLSHRRYAEPWLGLVHDGSQYVNKTSFHWLDAGTVHFLSWPEDSPEPDELSDESCIRVRDGYFETKECTFLGFSAVCQTPEFSVTGVNTRFYIKMFHEETSHQTYTRYTQAELHGLEGETSKDVWLVARPTASDVSDFTSCLLHCQDPAYCVIRYNPVWGCDVMDKYYFRSLQDFPDD